MSEAKCASCGEIISPRERMTTAVIASKLGDGKWWWCEHCAKGHRKSVMLEVDALKRAARASHDSRGAGAQSGCICGALGSSAACAALCRIRRFLLTIDAKDMPRDIEWLREYL